MLFNKEILPHATTIKTIRRRNEYLNTKEDLA